MVNTKINDYYEKLIKVGMALTAEKDYNRLLELILTEMRKIANADGGTLYILTEGMLCHKIMQNVSMNVFLGGGGESIGFAPIVMDEANISAYAAINRTAVNIPDVYHTNLFDFSGPKKFDKETGYFTKSMMAVPLVNRSDEVIGVVQLINAIEEGELVPFNKEIEKICLALSSQAGVALENMQYVENIRGLFDSFVKVLVTAVEERTPYNANHSRNVAVFVERFAKAINQWHEGPYATAFFDEEHIKKLVMAAWVHDIGKVTVPENVMNKPTRLASEYEIVSKQIELIEAKINQRYYQSIAEPQAVPETAKALWEADLAFVKHARELVQKVNEPSTFVDDTLLRDIDEIYMRHFIGVEESLLTDKAYEFLRIQRGTLTNEERSIMENHVITTEKMLSKMTFPKDLKEVPTWAVNHHEFLDGSGYSRGMKGDEITIEVRMLTIIDIYDALTATDRPYKKGMPPERAFMILGNMVKEGKLDGDLLHIFQHTDAWQFKN
jgi:HD-GYP domain-containing protein (c-di-GMP phosphodiesterase class II)